MYLLPQPIPSTPLFTPPGKHTHTLLSLRQEKQIKEKIQLVNILIPPDSTYGTFKAPDSTFLIRQTQILTLQLEISHICWPGMWMSSYQVLCPIYTVNHKLPRPKNGSKDWPETALPARVHSCQSDSLGTPVTWTGPGLEDPGRMTGKLPAKER